MLDGRDAMFAQAHDGRATRVDDVVGMRRKFDRVVEAKTQTATGGRRQHAHASRPSGMKSDA
jgi:hypothetical protein